MESLRYITFKWFLRLTVHFAVLQCWIKFNRFSVQLIDKHFKIVA